MELETGARIRTLREAAGVLAQELAARVGIDPTALSKIENGRRAVKSVELARIAEALKVSPLALLEDDPLLTAFPSAAGNAGATIADGAAYRRLLALTELHVVLEDAGIRTSPLLAQAPPVGHLEWPQAAQVLADWARKSLPLSPGGEIRFRELVVAIERTLRVDVLVEAYPGDALSGAAITHPSFPMIFLNAAQSESRSLFILAHELGHVLASHANEPIILDRELSSSNDAERLANAFAATFLMPEAEVREALADPRRDLSTLTRLTYDLGVSFESLVYRLHSLGVIAPATRDRLRDVNWQQVYARLSPATSGLDWSQVGELQARGRVRPAERVPAFLLKRALQAYHQGVIGIRPLAALLREKPDELAREIGSDDRFDGDLHAISERTDPPLGPVSADVAYSGLPV